MGINLTPRAATEGGIPYDKSIPYDAFKDENAHIDTCDNENGHFINATIFDEENGTTTTHQLIDSNFDMVFDGYQLSFDDGSSREFWNDDDFDGNFDTFGHEMRDPKTGKLIMCAFDFNTDGEMDEYVG